MNTNTCIIHIQAPPLSCNRRLRLTEKVLPSWEQAPGTPSAHGIRSLLPCSTSRGGHRWSAGGGRTHRLCPCMSNTATPSRRHPSIQSNRGVSRDIAGSQIRPRLDSSGLHRASKAPALASRRPVISEPLPGTKPSLSKNSWNAAPARQARQRVIWSLEGLEGNSGSGSGSLFFHPLFGEETRCPPGGAGPVLLQGRAGRKA